MATSSAGPALSTARIADACLAKLLAWMERLVKKSSVIGATPFFEEKYFPWVKAIEAQWPEIRRELDQVLEHRAQLPNIQDIVPMYTSTLSDDDRWKPYFFYMHGVRSEVNCLRCPVTTRAIESIPHMKTALFSILGPGKHLPPHRGAYNGVVRFHLGVKIPEPASSCGIRVGRVTAHWEEGKSLFFDDSFNHEAWNDTDQDRVVLFVDVVRPLRWPVSWLNSALLRLFGHAKFVTEGRKNQQKWETSGFGKVAKDPQQEMQVGL